MKDDMYPLFCFSVSSRVTPKKSQFLKCRLLGKKKKRRSFFLLETACFVLGAPFSGKRCLVLFFFSSQNSGFLFTNVLLTGPDWFAFREKMVSGEQKHLCDRFKRCL